MTFTWLAFAYAWCCCAAGSKCEELSRRLAEAERRAQDAEVRAAAAQQVCYITACLGSADRYHDCRPERVLYGDARVRVCMVCGPLTSPCFLCSGHS